MTTATETKVHTATFSFEHQDLMVCYSSDAAKGGNITSVVQVEIPEYIVLGETACKFADSELIRRKWHRLTDWEPTDDSGEPTEFSAEVEYLGQRPTFR